MTKQNKANEALVTQALVLEHFYYCPLSGKIFWIKPSPRIKFGREAGCYHNGYRVIGINGAAYKAHRIIWLYVYGYWPIEQIDHINKIRSDNRLINLREATNQSNHRNKNISPANTSGATGVSWHTRGRKWMAQIMVNYEAKYLGLFEHKEDAISARKSAELKYGFTNS